MLKPLQYEKFTKGKPRRFYICDRTKFANCVSGCKYTLDAIHAAHWTDDAQDFSMIGGDMYQRPKGDAWTLSQRYTETDADA